MKWVKYFIAILLILLTPNVFANIQLQHLAVLAKKNSGCVSGPSFTSNGNLEDYYLIDSDFGAGPIPDGNTTNGRDLTILGNGEPDYTASFDGGADFDGVNDTAQNTDLASDPITAYPFTLYARIRTPASYNATSDETILKLTDNDSGGSYWAIWVTSAEKAEVVARNTAIQRTTGATTLNSSTTYAIIGSFVSATERYIYVNAVEDGGSASETSVTYGSDVDRISLGYSGDSTPGNYADLIIIEAGIFSDTLTSQERTDISTTGLKGDCFD